VHLGYLRRVDGAGSTLQKVMPLEKTLQILQEEATRSKLNADVVELFVHRRLYDDQRKADEKYDDKDED